VEQFFMGDIDFERVQAVHPHWRGFLLLAKTGNVIKHLGHDSTGTYTRQADVLTVRWDKYGLDVFRNISGLFVHESFLTSLPKLDQLLAVDIADKATIISRISIPVPSLNYEISLRPKTSDIPTYTQVFIRREYDSPNLPDAPRSIVDLGANIGLATVFFGLRYPNAQIISVEPEYNNFKLMEDNTRALGARINPLHAAAWTEDGTINLHTETDDGFALGAWGAQVSDRATAASKRTPCFRLETLLTRFGLDAIDILKVDIEGAELEVFSGEAQRWLPKIKLIIVETHDRFRPGSDAAVRRALAPMFEHLPSNGENQFFRRL
jgi:FkbM family methyltransferase